MSDEFKTAYWDGDMRSTLDVNQTDIEMEAENYELHAASWVHSADGVECGYVRIYRQKLPSLLEDAKTALGQLEPTRIHREIGPLDIEDAARILREAIAREEAKNA